MEYSCFITQDYPPELREAFSFFDKNGDGVISVEEISQLLLSFGKSLSESELQEMVKRVDQNGDGRIDLNEFVFLLTNEAWLDDLEEELLEVFNAFDVNNDGVLSAEELHQAFRNLGENVTETEVEQVIKMADLDGDGKINYFEFTKIMMSC